MSKVVANYFPRNIAQYVPNMEFAADVIDGKHKISLGSPSTADPNGILSLATIGDGSAHTFTSADWATTFDGSSTHVGESSAGVINGTYGRCLSILGDASTDELVTLIGRDYLGQGMREAMTLNGAITLYGKKAFKYLDSVTVSSSSGGSDLSVGWTDVLGLPYAAEQVIGWTEDDVHIDIGRNVTSVSQAMIYASDASLFISNAASNGFIVGMSSVSTVANTTIANAVTIELSTTTVAGLALSILTTDAIGDAYSDFVGTDDHGLTGKIAKGGAIEMVSGTQGTAGAGTVVAHVEEGVRFIDADRTATMTSTTGDTRGTCLPYTSCDASVVYEVEYTVNTADLHGIEQYNG